MKLEDLQLAGREASLNRQNHYSGLVKEQLSKAYTALASFRKGGPTARQQLKLAFGCFSKALQYDRRFAEAYVGLAYVFLLLGDRQNALPLLQEALQRVPGDADATMFMAYLQQVKARKKSQPAKLMSAPALKPKAAEAIDYDELYDRTEAQIVANLQLMTMRPPQVTLEAEAYRQLKQQTQSYLDYCEKTRENLAILDQEIETDELQQRLEQLERLASRFRQALSHSEQLRALNKEIRQHREGVSELRTAISSRKMAPNQFEAELEKMLDNCDAVADRMDNLETQGCPIDTVCKSYEIWLNALEQLQELADELKD
ncbi:MAG: hypothetical protein ACAI44_30535 [Candidatus Sericytochromatia bacterium]